MTRDKRWQANFLGLVSRWKQFLSLKNCRSVRICSVLNRSSRDTTVYYRLIFFEFSWPNMVKWHHSGIDVIRRSAQWKPILPKIFSNSQRQVAYIFKRKNWPFFTPLPKLRHFTYLFNFLKIYFFGRERVRRRNPDLMVGCTFGAQFFVRTLKEVYNARKRLSRSEQPALGRHVESRDVVASKQLHR